MSDERPGSRSERHQRGRGKASRGEAAAPAGQTRVPIIEPLRPEPPRSSRRADARAGKRRRRTRIALSLVVVLGLIAGGVTWRLNQSRRPETAKREVAKARTQRTLLLQIPAPAGAALVSVLLVTDAEAGAGAVVLVPTRMLSQVPGFGSAVFGEALKLGGDDGPQLAKDTLTNQLGVIVDESWVVTASALGSLVDAVGGVDVAVDVDLPGDATSSDVALRQGQQNLRGTEAAAFATYGVTGQPELGRLNRLQLVLAGVLDKLAQAPVQTTIIPGPVADALRLLATARAAQQLSYKVVPVTDVDSGSDQETTRIDSAPLAELVASVLAGSVPANEFRPDNRVVVFNGVGNPAVGQSVTRRLNAAGFVIEKTSNADNFNYSQSQVLIFDSGDRAVARGEAVAVALGLSVDVVEASEDQQDVADVIVTIGADYLSAAASGSVSPSVAP